MVLLQEELGLGEEFPVDASTLIDAALSESTPPAKAVVALKILSQPVPGTPNDAG